MKIWNLALVGVAALGCNKAPSPPPQPHPKTVSTPSGPQRHIGMPAADMTKELREHCGSASNDLQAIEQYVKDRSRMDDAATTRLRSDLTELRKQMDRCLAMVHGMEEEHLGEPNQQSPVKSR